MLSSAVKNHIRYDTTDGEGETRRQRNERFGHGDKNPEINIPEYAFYLWNAYWELCSVRRDNETPINYRDIMDWTCATGGLISSREYAIIMQMDAAYRTAIAEEIRANTQRMEAKMRATRGAKKYGK